MDTFTEKKLQEFREKFTNKHVPARFRKYTNVTVEEVESFLTTAIQEAQAEERKRIALENNCSHELYPLQVGGKYVCKKCGKEMS